MKVHEGCNLEVTLDPTSGPWGNFYRCPVHGGPLGVGQVSEGEARKEGGQ